MFVELVSSPTLRPLGPAPDRLLCACPRTPSPGPSPRPPPRTDRGPADSSLHHRSVRMCPTLQVELIPSASCHLETHPCGPWQGKQPHLLSNPEEGATATPQVSGRPVSTQSPVCLPFPCLNSFDPFLPIAPSWLRSSAASGEAWGSQLLTSLSYLLPRGPATWLPECPTQPLSLHEEAQVVA